MSNVFAAAINALAEADKEGKRMAETLEKAKEAKPTTPYLQWTEEHGAYTSSGRAHQKLPPGVYDLALTQKGIYFVPVTPRTGALLRFEDEEAIIDEVMTEVENFWDRQPHFEKYGISFRRGILLHGPPGSGKSCTLQLIAADVVKRGGVVLLWQTSPDNFLACYREFRLVQPDTPVVIFLEDIDGLFETFRARESSILNILDGVEAMDQTIFVATTNYIEQLAERVVNRPSRFDRLFYVGMPGPNTRREYFESLLKGDEEFQVEKAVKDTHGWSLAHLKELFTAVVIMGAPYEVAHKRINQMFDKQHSAQSDEKVKSLMDRNYI